MAKFIESFLGLRRDRLQREAQQEVPENISEAIHAIFASQAGNRVMNWLIEGILIAPSFVPGNMNGRCCDTAFQEGQRAVVKMLLDQRDMFDQKRQEVAETEQR